MRRVSHFFRGMSGTNPSNQSAPQQHSCGPSTAAQKRGSSAECTHQLHSPGKSLLKTFGDCWGIPQEKNGSDLGTKKKALQFQTEILLTNIYLYVAERRMYRIESGFTDVCLRHPTFARAVLEKELCFSARPSKYHKA